MSNLAKCVCVSWLLSPTNGARIRTTSNIASFTKDIEALRDASPGRELEKHWCDKWDLVRSEAEGIAEETLAPETGPVLAQLASVSRQVYKFASPTAGWHLVKAWNTNEEMDACESNNVGIYQKLKKDGSYECILAFAGTDNSDDRSADLDLAAVDWCGFRQVHRGFASKAALFWSGKRFNEFVEFLNDRDNCGSGEAGKPEIKLVGHSLGGALATLVGACANKYGTFRSDLYTFGAPGVSKVQIENPGGPMNCFKGVRFYSKDHLKQDPVPSILSPLGFLHPKVNAVRIMKTVLKSAFSKHVYQLKKHECSWDSAKVGPRFLRRLPSAGLGHKAKKYVMRLLNVIEWPGNLDIPMLEILMRINNSSSDSNAHSSIPGTVVDDSDSDLSEDARQ